MAIRAKTAKKRVTKAKLVNARVTVNVQSKAVSATAVEKRKLPAGTVKLKGTNGLVIDIQKLSKGLIRDQRARMVSSMGCISNPGGPGC